MVGSARHRIRLSIMPNLFCFGLGYSAEHHILDWGAGFDRVAGTVRDPDKAAWLARAGIGGKAIDMVVFNGTGAPDDIAPMLNEADCLVVSVPPEADGDPVLRWCADAVAAAGRLRSIVYLSTVGVYGDHAGAWVDETTPAAPVTARSRARLDAERSWTALAARSGKALTILRLAGIYGPGRNALVQVASRTARRIVKPGQVFNRIHVADIAQAIEAAFVGRHDGIVNVADDEPTSPGEPIALAADLLGMAPPPETPFADAARTMSPMALSFYGENRRVRNDKLKRDLGVRLKYPTFREGIAALFAASDHLAAPR
jgi:dTDP-4-dehydrorhamnose reductase